METSLYVEGLTVSFEGFLALKSLNLILEGEEKIRLVIGPNGAGKSTLFDVLSGQVKPTSGRVLFNGSINLLDLSEHAIARHGVSRKFQTPSVFPHHTILENMALASGSKGCLASAFARNDTPARNRIAFVLDQVGLLPYTNDLAGTLSHGQKQWLEIAMLLVQSPTLLLLDEPVAGMTKGEKEKTAELIETIVEQATCSVMLIEHDMDFVRKMARNGHRVTVLHEGRVLSEGPLERVQSDERVIEAYLGRGMVGAGKAC